MTRSDSQCAGADLRDAFARKTFVRLQVGRWRRRSSRESTAHLPATRDLFEARAGALPPAINVVRPGVRASGAATRNDLPSQACALYEPCAESRPYATAIVSLDRTQLTLRPNDNGLASSGNRRLKRISALDQVLPGTRNHIRRRPVCDRPPIGDAPIQPSPRFFEGAVTAVRPARRMSIRRR